jgi:hypothetical protein
LVVTETLSLGLPDLIQTYLLATGAFLAARVLGAPIDQVIVAGLISFQLMGTIAKVRRAITQLAQADATYWALLSTVSEVEKAGERFDGQRMPTLDNGCELRNISFSYGRGPVLSDVTLQIPAGRITTLVGEVRVGQDHHRGSAARPVWPRQRHGDGGRHRPARSRYQAMALDDRLCRAGDHPVQRHHPGKCQPRRR